MRYQRRIRKRVIAILITGLVTIAIAASLPKIYSTIFGREEDTWTKSVFYKVPEALDYFYKEAEDKDVSVQLEIFDNNYIKLELEMDELDLGGILISSSITLKARILRDSSGRVSGLEGKAFSRNVTFNSTSFDKLVTSFRITKKELDIKSLRIGKPYNIMGKIALESPFDTQLRVEIKRAAMRDFAIIAKAKHPDRAVGVVNGLFNITGPLKNLSSKGILESRKGKLGRLGYDSASIRIEGFGPIMTIVDSNIKDKTGKVLIDGYIDLRKVTKGSVLAGLKFKSDMKQLVWDEWDIKTTKDELKMSKDIGEDMRIGFKTMARDPLITYRDGNKEGEMSLEYKMGLESMKMKLRDNEEFFGVEHNIEF